MYAHLRLRQVSYSNIRHIQCRVQKEVTVRWPLSLFSPTYNKESVPAFHTLSLSLAGFRHRQPFPHNCLRQPPSPRRTTIKKSVPRNRGTDLYE